MIELKEQSADDVEFTYDAIDKMSAEEALSSKKNRITSWVIQVYRLNSFRGRWYYAVNVISAKVSRASESPPVAGKRKREDFTQYL